MAAFTDNGYSIADITALLAIPAIDRPAFKVALLVAGVGWYEYDNAATTGGLTPADSPATGRWFPVSREVLRANRTYYVRTDGSDSNSGLANTSGGAFLTIQKAIDVVASLDISIFDVTVQVANGTYTQALTLKMPLGSGTLILQGNTATPSNVIISTTSADCITFTQVGTWNIKGFKLQTTTSGSGLFVAAIGSRINYESLDFGVIANIHLFITNGGYAEATGNYSISGGGNRHFNGNLNGAIRCQSRIITITGTPNFLQAFAIADFQGVIVANGCTFIGSATGSRYIADSLGQIVALGGATYLPGNVAGSLTNGGQYL